MNSTGADKAGSYTGATHSEQIKTLSKGCPSISITGDPAVADFTVAWDSKTWQQTSWGDTTVEAFCQDSWP